MTKLKITHVSFYFPVAESLLFSGHSFRRVTPSIAFSRSWTYLQPWINDLPDYETAPIGSHPANPPGHVVNPARCTPVANPLLGHREGPPSYHEVGYPPHLYPFHYHHITVCPNKIKPVVDHFTNAKFGFAGLLLVDPRQEGSGACASTHHIPFH